MQSFLEELEKHGVRVLGQSAFYTLHFTFHLQQVSFYICLNFDHAKTEASGFPFVGRL